MIYNLTFGLQLRMSYTWIKPNAVQGNWTENNKPQIIKPVARIIIVMI